MDIRRLALVIPMLTGPLALVPRAGAQSPPAPRVTVTATGEATAAPARGHFTVGVETLAASAAQASAGSARTSQAVLQALQQAGLAPGDMTGTRVSVAPRWRYDEPSRRQLRDGFQAVTTISVDTAALPKLGAYIDAALNAGATTVSDIDYSAADPEGLRRQALARAVQSARGDAEAIAAAAGSSLGELLQIGTGSGIAPESSLLGGVTLTAARMAAPATAVVPAEITASATISAQWQLVTPARAH